MFGLKRKAAPPAPPVIAPAPERTAAVLKRPVGRRAKRSYDDALAPRYRAAAQAIGLDSGAAIRAQIADLVVDEDWRWFDPQEVEDFLGAQAPAGVYMVWKPLRRADVGKLGRSHTHDHGQFSNQQYGKPVPVEVLEMVAKIEARIPGRLHYFVSDFQKEAPVRDPFLAVSGLGVAMWILAQWDEPDYVLKRADPAPA